MSHDAFASPLVLEPRRSRYLHIYLVLIHALALAVIAAPLNLSLTLRLAVAVVVVLSFIRHITRLPPRRLAWQTDEDWQLLFQDGSERTGQLRPDTYVSPWLVILRFQLEQGGRCSVVILPDMLDPQSFRRLRVRLYQARLAETAEDSAV